MSMHATRIIMLSLANFVHPDLIGCLRTKDTHSRRRSPEVSISIISKISPSTNSPRSFIKAFAMWEILQWFLAVIVCTLIDHTLVSKDDVTVIVNVQKEDIHLLADDRRNMFTDVVDVVWQSFARWQVRVEPPQWLWCVDDALLVWKLVDHHRIIIIIKYHHYCTTHSQFSQSSTVSPVCCPYAKSATDANDSIHSHWADYRRRSMSKCSNRSMSTWRMEYHWPSSTAHPHWRRRCFLRLSALVSFVELVQSMHFEPEDQHWCHYR